MTPSWHVAAPEDSEPDTPLVEAVNAAVSALIADGTIAGIYAKYGVDYRRP